jgi:hypothetical protein
MPTFDTFDRTGAVEFPFPTVVVFRALETAVPTLKGMKIAESNQIAGHLFIKTGASAWSWGEKVQLSVLDAGPGRSRLQIASGGKTIMGSATTHSKNRKNVQNIISATSKELELHGDEWTRELAPTPPPPPPPPPPTLGQSDIETRLAHLKDLHTKGLISDEDFESRKISILDDL